MQEDRLKKTLSKDLEIKAMLPEMWAKDWHLGEDCREMDNKDRLKWIVIENKNDEMVIATEKVLIERYPVKPWLPWQMGDELIPRNRFVREGIVF
jgi:hypothetical protein